MAAREEREIATPEGRIEGALRKRSMVFSTGRRIGAILRYVIPTTDWGDYLFGLFGYVFKLRRMPRLRSPKLFNDHLLELKLSGGLTDPLRQFITDKAYAKDYIAWVAGSQYTLRTFDILRSDADIDRFAARDIPCVIKPTHLSGSSILFQFDRNTPVNRYEMKRWLRTDYYRRSREKNYRYLEPKIIVEELFSDDGCTPPQDYKFFCFHGCPRLVQVDSDRFKGHTRDLYDIEWNRLAIAIEYPLGIEEIPKPRRFGEMIEIATKLSRPFSFLRVDMYVSDTKVKVGELTNCHGNATEWISPPEAELWLGELFDGRSFSADRLRS